MCARCKQPMVLANVTVSYLGNRFPYDLLKCPGCGKVHVSEGLATAFVSGSTAAITTVEYEPGLEHDLAAALERLFPRDMRYRHHERWNDDNGRSHVRAAFLKPGLSVPVSKGALMLGTWQQVVLVELDTRPRKREIALQVMGE